MKIDKQKIEQLRKKKNLKILAIESSCDETAVAIVEDGRKLLANEIASQIDIHTRFGGVVPEVASRNHITAISNVCSQALAEANLTLDDIDAIAVTYGAGLLGALLVGVSFAKGLAYMSNKPLIPVNHIRGHIASNYISHPDLEPPFVCLMISGGHTAILKINSYTQMEMLGTTVDDAVGEAFDKVARVVGLGYPGGPKIDNLAKQGKSNINFINKPILAGTNNFSFSGIKTAVINYVHNAEQKGEKLVAEDVCASFQTAVVNELATKAIRATLESGLKKLVVAGGVSANSFLKARLEKDCKQNGIELFMPELKLCTDNAAMIGSEAYYYFTSGGDVAELSQTAKSVLPLEVNISKK